MAFGLKKKEETEKPFNLDAYIREATSGAGDFDVEEYVNEAVGGKNNDISNYVNEITGKRDVKTSQGLYQTAVGAGLNKQADKIIKKNEGETAEAFSGGLISDFFDLLNTGSYVAAGALKGRTIGESIKQRSSFTETAKDIPSLILGTALDIAVDPFTYIAPWTIAKKIPGAAKVGGAIKKAVVGERVTKAIEGTAKTYETVEGIPNKFKDLLSDPKATGKYLADKFVYMFGRDPVYRQLEERRVKNLMQSASNVKKLTKVNLNLPEEKMNKLLSLGEDFRFERASDAELSKFLTPEELTGVREAFQLIDDLGQEMVDAGLLSSEKYLQNKGKYMKAIYEKYREVNPNAATSLKAKISPIKARKEGLTAEQLKEAGQINNPQYLFARTAIDMIKNIENARFFNDIGGNFAADVAQKGFAQLPKGESFGKLAGKFVPEAIHRDLTQLIKVPSETSKFLKGLTGEFKFMKVVMNPASHVRNIISNKLLNNFDEAGIPLYRLDKEVGALTSLLKKDEWYKELDELGAIQNTFSAQELDSILDTTGLSKYGSKYSQMKEFFSDIYQNEELLSKMAMYKYQRINKGLDKQAAWEIAERATFNYSQVTPTIRTLRTQLFGLPFITFTVKSTPVIAKTVGKSPTKISNIGKIRTNIERVLSDKEETAEERASEPSWVKNGFYMKMPWRDDKGRSGYLDLTYFLPFGDLVKLGDESQLNLFAQSPAGSVIRDLSRNKDFYGNQIFRETDSLQSRTADIMKYISKVFLPPPVADQIPTGYNPRTGEPIRGKFFNSLEAAPDNVKRTIEQELARMVGMKVQPMVADVQETYNEWNRKRDLEKLLIENQQGRQIQIFDVNEEAP